MTCREIVMWEILAMLRRVHLRDGQRATQRLAGDGRTTIRRRVACAANPGTARLAQLKVHLRVHRTVSICARATLRSSASNNR